MEDAQNQVSENQDGLANDVMDSIGVNDAAENNDAANQADVKDDLPLYAKERLGRQEKRHRKEMRQMQEQLSQLSAQLTPKNNSNDYDEPVASQSYGQDGLGEEDKIRRAVAYALKAKEMEEAKAKDAEKAQHVHKQYQRLQDDLDAASDKYDDFEEVVRAPDAPFSQAMVDTSLLLPNAADVLYKLGKSKDELKRISALHPLDQAKEMVKLSHALIAGGSTSSTAQNNRPINTIKSNPVNASHSQITDKTPVSELRKRMRDNWK